MEHDDELGFDDFGLESMQPLNEKSTNDVALDFNNIDKILNDISVLDIVLRKSEITSAKFDRNREEKIQNGFSLINQLNTSSEQFSINPLFLMLCKFWEHKEHRATIKAMLDDEADRKGFYPSEYLNEQIRNEINVLGDISASFDRMLTVMTFYKERKRKKTKNVNKAPKMKSVNVDGVMYEVPIRLFEEAKTKPEFVEDREKLIEYVKSIGTLKTDLTL